MTSHTTPHHSTPAVPSLALVFHSMWFVTHLVWNYLMHTQGGLFRVVRKKIPEKLEYHQL